ncbi:MAG TPA: hypothetical protein VF620_12380 [Allosphingosinicella sp.]|jgi:hypothetical protein
MTCDAHLCVPCGLHEPRRNVYFDGKLLLARDFEDEQVYHIAKQQLLNATLHGTGTACGLKVVEHPAEDCRARFALLQPGLALDCCGREIIVPKKVAIPIGELLDSNPDLVEKLDGTRDLVLALKRCDRPGELAPIILADCEGAAEGGKPGRILEGFDFHLFAAEAGALAPAYEQHEPRLDWRQTLTFSESTPAAVAVDEETAYAYVAIVPDDEEEVSSRILVYERRNHDIVTALDGPGNPVDLAVSPVGDQVYLSFANAGASGIAVYRKSKIRTVADPLGTIELEGQARLAVSPRTGALFALRLDEGVILAWSQEAIAEWAGQDPPPPAGPSSPVELKLKDWTARDAENHRGAIFTISPDGARLLVVDGIGSLAVRMVEVALLFGGEAAEVVPSDPNQPLLPTPAGERLVAGNWSLDGRYIFLLSEAGTAEEPQALLRRYERLDADGSLHQRGQGLAVPASHAIDLAVAPGERWAYALVGRVENDAIEATVVALDMEEAQRAGDTPSIEGVRTEEPLPGVGLSQRLTLSGRQLYVALADESGESQPDRGLVAVIEPDEADCGARFRAAVEGCPVCDDQVHHVVLAHLPRYDAAKRPRIRDRDPRDGEVAIDNFTYRPLIPSAQNLRAVVECILDEGVAEGPPGPRGDPGDQGETGARGPGIQTVAVKTLESGDAATAVLSAIGGDPEGDQLLTLGIPKGANGPIGPVGPHGPGIQTVAVKTLDSGAAATAVLSAIGGDPEGDQLLTLGIPKGANGSIGPVGPVGPRGPGIDKVFVNTLDPGQPATAVLTPIGLDPENDQLLTLNIPRGKDGTLPAGNYGKVSALSWTHGKTRGANAFNTLGFAIYFDRLVSADSLATKAGPNAPLVSFAFEVLSVTGGQSSCLCPVQGKIELISTVVEANGLISKVTVAAAGTPLVRGIRLMPNNLVSGAPVRVVLRCDFVLDEAGTPIDGNFLAAKLPTGDGIAGGLFESWLTIEVAP